MAAFHFTQDRERRCFLSDGKPFFYLADTCWLAFSNCSESDFDAYLSYREAQGFNVVQISVLPLERRPGALLPFAVEDRHFVYDRPNEAYFEKANRLLDLAVRHGIYPCLHLFWNSFVPDDWGSIQPVPDERVADVAAFLLRQFRDRTPFWSVSGDTRFETERLVRFYRTTLDVMQKEIPDAQVTFHLNPPYFPPKELLDHPMYNFHSYQSGHEDGVFLTWIPGLSGDFLRLHANRPLLNNEMCYERIGRYKNREQPFTPRDVRQAIWLSLLSGASAGFAYGAHGIWQARQPGGPMTGEETWGPSGTMMEALRYPGAEEAAFAKSVFEREDLFGLEPLDTEFSESEGDGTPRRGADLVRVRARAGRRAVTFWARPAGTVPAGVRAYDLERKHLLPEGSRIVRDVLTVASEDL